MPKATVITLGCPKNTVESEYLLGMLRDDGFELNTDINNTDVVVIHTCSFIRDARAESEKCINDVLSLKNKRDVKVYVSGCLAQLLKNDLKIKFPGIDGCAGTGALDQIPKLISGEKTLNLFSAGGLNESPGRVLSSPLPYAYLKISEGCSHRCSFCIIPGLRGRYKSRDIDSLADEASALAESGIKELILVAQDTTGYGSDIYGAFSLDKLLAKLSKIKGLKWIRLLYAYPSSVTDELIDVMKEHKNICAYMDMPIQHVSRSVLSAMKRPLDAKETVARIKERFPEIVLRTSLITGFPGETNKDIKELEDFLRRGYFRYAGVFEYSDQEHAVSSKLKGHVGAKAAGERKARLERIQSEVFNSQITGLKGSKIEFMAEKCVKFGKKYLISGRTAFQAPEIDGCAVAVSSEPLSCGKFYKGIITGNEGYEIQVKCNGIIA